MSQNAVLKPWTPAEAPDILFRNAKVVDVLHGDVKEGQDILISHGTFTTVTPSSTNFTPPARDEEDIQSQKHGRRVEIDLEGKYFLCPGLIDCHVHLTANAGQDSMGNLFNASPNAIAYRTTWNAKNMLRRGFTTVRDTGGADFALRQAIAENVIAGPRVFIAGKALSQTGGHADLRAAHQGASFKCCDSSTPGFGRVCDGVPACLEAARDELRQGADFLKIMVGGGVSSPADPLNMLQFSGEEVRAITSTAAQMGRIVTAHAYTVPAIRHAIDNGCLGIEHANFIDDETAALCTAKGVTITPTLTTYKAMSEPPYEVFLPPDGQVKNKEVLASGLDSLTTLSKARVAVCFGTDLLAGMHPRQNEEFTIRRAVLSDLEILQSATVNAARYLGREESLGRIADGFLADALLLVENPLEDVTILSEPEKNVKAIIKDGRVVLSRLPDLIGIDPLYK